ncbi:cobalt-precorrin-6A reductase [Taklimakanibacter albus]|uniref:Cobalt-precorrin-6A reductase n=1 Tax=Taklimakanibacter albus TaxID=2800327 RepID=A0ACC5QXD7_9HYPH|nr:cobalt-precorrin-6A reductase [Aestuariivirga sp. YIM B02566]MBK1865037.1 cobalt-precorrin-6A reductase [Aestuariivirga sp. YIM B02566]
MASAKGRVLILGGTAEARDLAGLLCDAGYAPVTSLAGITSAPAAIRGETRQGGFGGPDGLARYLEEGDFQALVDATHPFAGVISHHATEAARRCRLPLIRLERPSWALEPGERWTEVPDNDAALQALPKGARVLLTIGRKEVRPFLARADISGVARMIEPMGYPPAAGWQVLLARPPFGLDAELQLLGDHGVTHLVTKNSGGEETRAKLTAARIKGVEVVMIRRPPKPAAYTVADPGSLLILLDERLGA